VLESLQEILVDKESCRANYKQANHLDIADAAYIAGVIDGEGTITLSRRHKNENRQLVVSISSSEKSMLEYLLDVVIQPLI
jgi:hypothetical protein